MIKDTDYIYASSRIKASGAKGLEKERLDGMLNALNEEQLSAFLKDTFSISDSDSYYGADFADTILTKAVNLVKETAPYPEIFDFLLYKYDCSNLKTAIKSKIRNIDSKGLYYTCGSVPADKAEAALKTENFSDFPKNMASAAKEAYETYLKTHEARAIDLILDRACYEDMTVNAKKSKCAFFSKLVAAKADITNIITLIRILKSDDESEIAAALLRRSLVGGGDIPKENFFSGDSPAELSALENPDVPAIIREAISSVQNKKDISFSEIEKIFDDVYLSLTNEYKYKPFGIEIPAIYIIMTEAEVKNIRIISSAISAGESHDRIREKVRWSYV